MLQKKIAVVFLAAGMLLFAGGHAQAESVKVPVNKISAEGIGEKIGDITFKDANGGLDVMVELMGIAEGEHGMHIHANPNCGPAEKDGKMGAGLAAGGHYDPTGAKVHAGPGKMGHKGDLPKIVADKDMKVKMTVHAPNLSVKDIKERSVMIHAGGDNYSDSPAPLGGGGGRIACGVIK